MSSSEPTNATTIPQPRGVRRYCRQPFITTDADGTAIINVPLHGGGTAQTTHASYTALMEAGLTDQWVLTSNGCGNSYVKARRGSSADSPGCMATISRLVIRAQGGERVHYQDGNPMNLRPANLTTEAGLSRTKGGTAHA